MDLREDKNGNKRFDLNGKTYVLHYDADGYGIYGICRIDDEIITSVNRKIQDKELKKAWQHAQFLMK